MAQENKRKLSLPLSFTTVLTIVFLAVGAMTGAYVWGVMSGRSGTATPAAGEVASTPKQATPAADNPGAFGRILKPQELEFASVLKGDGKPQKKQELPKPKPKEPAPQPKEPAKSIPSVAAGGGQPTSVTDTPQEPHPGGMYDYTFQVAALKDEQAVDNLRQNLEGRGLRTRMERSGKVYLVLVLLRGDEARANDLLAITREMRLGEPLLRGKKPVSQ